MNYSALKFEQHQHVAHVQLNRPDVMNTLNQELIDEIYSCFNELGNDREVCVIVLSGLGRAFCAGGDVSFLKIISSQSHTETRQLLGGLFHKLTVLVRVEKPVIGALHGYVLGAGFSLSLLCDLRVAAEGTKFGAEFPMMGLSPEIGCTHTLPALVGLGNAMELIITARRFDADEANINALCYHTEDHKEAASAFLEKRKPAFKGR